MSTNTGIEWTDATWNTLAGCRKVSAGCKHCYAQTMTHRLAEMARAKVAKGEEPGKLAAYQQAEKWDGTFVPIPGALAEPFKWKGPRKVFVNSMSDTFGEGVADDYIAAMFGVMAATPHITYQVLTKRPERALEWFGWLARTGGGPAVGMYQAARHYGVARQQLAALDMSDNPRWPLPNVWIGTSVEDQEAVSRIPILTQIPAAVRFLSIEPLLGPVDLRVLAPEVRERIDWIIIGGESGPGARRCHLGWITFLVWQAKQAGIPVFVKQLGSAPTYGGDVLRLRDRKGGDMSEWPEDLRVREFPEV